MLAFSIILTTQSARVLEAGSLHLCRSRIFIATKRRKMHIDHLGFVTLSSSLRPQERISRTCSAQLRALAHNPVGIHARPLRGLRLTPMPSGAPHFCPLAPPSKATSKLSRVPAKNSPNCSSAALRYTFPRSSSGTSFSPIRCAKNKPTIPSPEASNTKSPT